MRVSDFDYRLPKELIAQRPLSERDASRLLIVRRGEGTIEHARFRDLPAQLRLGDRMVVNDARVIQARLFGHREGGTGLVEVLLYRTLPGRPEHPTFEALARPARKVLAGTILYLGERRVPVSVLEARGAKSRVLEFPRGFSVGELMESEGHVPLPPYIQREDEDEDRERYQTVFAKAPGAIAAPTAGLHFTEETLSELGQAGIARSSITLDVGLGTFAPVTVEEVEAHVMEEERYDVPTETAEEILKTRSGQGRVVAVGTTVVRTLETAAHFVPELNVWSGRSGEGATKVFIYPPYEFRVVDALLTNFHLPRSTLLMLVSAFGGTDLVRRAYEEAVKEKYRFYSYGDAMLLL